ncbi:MAG: hypothetical protein RBT45_08600 [Acholeplasmataceae bacterium]|nr:hypothetical protein [Acholeplasmataceae bacterium]
MKYTRLIPFMDKEELRKIAFEVINGDLQGVKLEVLFPFLGRETLHEIVDLLIEKKEAKSLHKAIPFIGRDKVFEIYVAAEKGELPDFDTSSCIPFLGSDKIKEIFRELVKHAPVDSTDDEDEE